MISHIFYFIVAILVFFEMSKITLASEHYDGLKDFEKTKVIDEKKYPYLKIMTFLSTIYLLITCLGLMSSSWYIFLIILILSMINGYLFKNANPKIFLAYIRIDSTISALLLLFAILNRYHFKIDIIGYLFS